jgi:hypothetical protein
MFKFIRNYKLNKAFSSYLQQLGPALPDRYGLADQYTVLQIEKTAETLKLNMRYIPYAIALFRSEESVNTVDRHTINQEFLNILRREIADAIFDGDISYTAKDTIRAGIPGGWKGGKPNGHVTMQAMWGSFDSR